MVMKEKFENLIKNACTAVKNWCIEFYKKHDIAFHTFIAAIVILALLKLFGVDWY